MFIYKFYIDIILKYKDTKYLYLMIEFKWMIFKFHFSIMTIASDFFFDLTPKSSTPAYSYDIVESELLPTPKGGFNNRIESSIKQNRSAPIILEGTPNRNFSNRENSDFDNIYLKTKISKLAPKS